LPPQRGIAAASILGALSPDVDCLLMPFGWDIYLRAHQIGTHTLVGAGVTGLASAALVRATGRGRSCVVLATAATIGAWSHLAADVVSGGTLQPAWPFSDAALSLPLVAMADIWTIAVIAAGAALAWRWPHGRQRGACIALLILVAFLCLKAGLLFAALTRTTIEGANAHERASALRAQWGSMTGWHLFDRSASGVRGWQIDVRGGEAMLAVQQAATPESPLVRMSRALGTVSNFLHVHDLTFAVERQGPGDRRTVLWSDVRYCRQPRRRTDPLECSLWFGGTFAGDGRVLVEQVRVGSWVQSRMPAARAR
jgi:membrane-bound metal-dependent hydrolase YbcI (DUF457 family)